MDQLWNNIAKMRYQSAGKMKIPLVITASCGVGTFESYQHSQVLYSTIAQIPGIKVVIPSNAYDAKGLLISSIRDDDPVVFLEHKSLLKSSVEENVPVEEYSIPLGKASVRRAGNDVTVVAMMLMVNRALEAAKELEKDGISVEVIDPRTIVPFDKETILESLKKTGRLVIVDESHERCGMASQIAAIAAEEAFEYLKAPIRRVASLNVPIPYMQSQIDCVIPTQAKILEAVKRTYKT
jgi:pyruvate dehydrogenase E1 component beta subunit